MPFPDATALSLFPGLIAVLKNGRIVQTSGADAKLKSLAFKDDAAVVAGRAYRIHRKTVGDTTYCYAVRV